MREPPHPTVFLVIFIPGKGKSFDGDSVDSIFDRVRAAIGDTASVLIHGTAKIQYLEAEEKQAEILNIKL